MNPKKLYRKIKSKINTKIQFLLINPLEYFQDPHKVYLASADQFAGMEEICESESFPDCRHFYSVIGGLGGLNILAKLKNLESIIFFDINTFTVPHRYLKDGEGQWGRLGAGVSPWVTMI